MDNILYAKEIILHTTMHKYCLTDMFMPVLTVDNEQQITTWVSLEENLSSEFWTGRQSIS
jgi:hypothetical protein